MASKLALICMNLRIKQPACETSNLDLDDVDNLKQRKIIQDNSCKNTLRQGMLFLQIWHKVEILALPKQRLVCDNVKYFVGNECCNIFVKSRLFSSIGRYPTNTKRARCSGCRT